MNQQQIVEKATQLREQVGGNIFGFPVDETNPFSKYAVAMFDGKKMKAFPELLNISEVAAGIAEVLQVLKEEGLDHDFERNVRLISYEAQMNAPDVTMRRLKKEMEPLRHGFEEGVDVMETDTIGQAVSARGLIKFSYFASVDEKLPKAIDFMNKFYQLISTKRYGKTAAAIKQEVRRMSKNEAAKWIEKTYSSYIDNDMEVFDIMKSLKET